MTSLRDDISALIDDAATDLLLRASVPSPIEEYVDKLLHHAELVTWYYQGTLRGLVAFYANDPTYETAFVTMVVVSQNNRRAGIGRALLEAALMNMTVRGFSKCVLKVHSRNSGAIALYRALGFEQIAAVDGVLTMRLGLLAPASQGKLVSEK